MSTPSEHLARNLKDLRTRRGLTQQQLATKAGIPRATWQNLESGGGNPTLSVLVRAAEALQVSLEELISAPPEVGRRVPATALKVRVRTGVECRQLVPDPLPHLQIERMALPVGGRMVGVPHTPGTREYLACELGVVELTVSGEVFRLDVGDVATFRGDQRHSYHNPGTVPAVAYSVVVLG